MGTPKFAARSLLPAKQQMEMDLRTTRLMIVLGGKVQLPGATTNPRAETMVGKAIAGHGPGKTSPKAGQTVEDLEDQLPNRSTFVH